MNYQLHLQDAERDAHALNAQYPHDRTLRAAIAGDLAIRRAAVRLLRLFRFGTPHI